jgi:hypothetical protein
MRRLKVEIHHLTAKIAKDAETELQKLCTSPLCSLRCLLFKFLKAISTPHPGPLRKRMFSPTTLTRPPATLSHPMGEGEAKARIFSR